MKEFFLNIYKHWILVLILLGLAILILYRAYILPFTHDESATWIYLRHTNVWGCFFDTSCWTSANNHWLNTILLQLSANLGGEIPWVMRMPNVLAGWTYLLTSAFLVTRYLKNNWAQLFGFLILTAHIYLLDFFSLARGYGLMMAGVFFGGYSLLRYLEKVELKWLCMMLCALFLAILSNFTALIPLASILCVWFVSLLAIKKYHLLWIHGRIVLLFVLGNYLLLRIPIHSLTHNGEFEWGASGLKETIRDLFNNLWAGAHYFDYRDPMIFFWFVFIILSFGLIVLVFFSKVKSQPTLSVLYLLLIVAVFAIVALQLFTNAKAPIGRKSIFLIPFIFCPLAISQCLITKKSISRAVGIGGSCLILIHFFSTIEPHLKSTREWYYDSHYPELFSTITPKESLSDSVRLGASWIFIPSLTFYQKSQSLPISGLIYQKQLVVDTTMQYYYLDPSDTVGISLTPFVIDKMIGPFYLYRKK